MRAGDRVTLRWATSLGIALSANLSAFLERIERDEQVRKVLADEGLEPVAVQSPAA